MGDFPWEDLGGKSGPHMRKETLCADTSKPGCIFIC